jgi:tetratricopeptide (TPR) repeat protein
MPVAYEGSYTIGNRFPQLTIGISDIIHGKIAGYLGFASMSQIELKNWYEEGRRRMSENSDAGAIDAFDLAIDNDFERAQAYFYRAVCYYRLGNYRQSKNDLQAAALLGCKNALFWSKYETKKPVGNDSLSKIEKIEC